MDLYNQLRSVERLHLVALALRTGLGVLFVIGGLNKLSQLLDPSRQAAILESYWGSTGYVNQFFNDYLFQATALWESVQAALCFMFKSTPFANPEG